MKVNYTDSSKISDQKHTKLYYIIFICYIYFVVLLRYFYMH